MPIRNRSAEQPSPSRESPPGVARFAIPALARIAACTGAICLTACGPQQPTSSASSLSRSPVSVAASSGHTSTSGRAAGTTLTGAVTASRGFDVAAPSTRAVGDLEGGTGGTCHGVGPAGTASASSLGAGVGVAVMDSAGSVVGAAVLGGGHWWTGDERPGTTSPYCVFPFRAVVRIPDDSLLFLQIGELTPAPLITDPRTGERTCLVRLVSGQAPPAGGTGTTKPAVRAASPASGAHASRPTSSA